MMDVPNPEREFLIARSHEDLTVAVFADAIDRLSVRASPTFGGFVLV